MTLFRAGFSSTCKLLQKRICAALCVALGVGMA